MITFVLIFIKAYSKQKQMILKSNYRFLVQMAYSSRVTVIVHNAKCVSFRDERLISITHATHPLIAEPIFTALARTGIIAFGPTTPWSTSEPELYGNTVTAHLIRGVISPGPTAPWTHPV